MNRNWDIMRNAANAADPYRTTSRMDQGRTRERERFTSRDREEGWGSAGMFDGMGNYGESPRSTYRHEHEGYEPRHDAPYARSGGPEFFGRVERGIDRAFGRDWERGRREDEREEQRRFREDVHPSLWDRIKGVFRGKGPKNWKRSDDRIYEEVCEALTFDDHVDATDIEVAVNDGEVTLSGAVPSRRMKRLAEDVVDDVSGVRDVHNRIRVRI